MTAIECIEQANQIEISTIAANYVVLTLMGKELHGPCPVCRSGTDRFWINAKINKATCRRCDQTWDTVALYAAISGLTMSAAARELIGEAYQSYSRAPLEAQPYYDTVEAPSEDLQKEFRKIIFDSKDKILESDAYHYLRSRLLTPEVIERFHVGFTQVFHPVEKKPIPAVVIPWASRSEIYGVKYRFIEAVAPKYTSAKGTVPILFGQHIPRAHDRILLLEGEINGMSVYSADCGCDVLSFGGEKNLPGILAALEITKTYPEVCTWVDSVKAFRVLRKHIPGIKGIISERMQMDANEMLMKLGNFAVQSAVEKGFSNMECPNCFGKGTYSAEGMLRACEHDE